MQYEDNPDRRPPADQSDRTGSAVLALRPRHVRTRWVGTLVGLALVATACTGTGEAGWSRVPHVEAVFGGDGQQLMLDVAAGGPGLVAVGAASKDGDSDAMVWTSSNGRDWTLVASSPESLGGPGNQVMRGVTAGGPGLVAVGDSQSDGGTDAAVWTSSDGVAWSRVPGDAAALGGDRDQVMWSVTTGGPGLVAAGSEGFDAAVWTSVDGVAWSRVPHDDTVFGSEGRLVVRSVTSGGPGLVAVGAEEVGADSRAAVWTSPDGLTWSRVSHDEEVFGGEGFQAMFGLTSGGPGLVAVGGEQSGTDSNAAVWVSVDGLTWSRSAGDPTALGGEGSQVMFGVAAGDESLVAVGADPGPSGSAGALWRSPDGVTWSRIVVEDDAPGGLVGLVTFAVTTGGPGMVAVGQEIQEADSNAAVWMAGG